MPINHLLTGVHIQVTLKKLDLTLPNSLKLECHRKFRGYGNGALHFWYNCHWPHT